MRFTSKQIRSLLRRRLRDLELEYEGMEHPGTGYGKRLHIEIGIYRDICMELGIGLPRRRECALAGCGNRFLVSGRKKYCSGACRQAAYRRRHGV